jgi:hypothetical protein
VGSSGEKRKGREHLPKVGTRSEERGATRRDREAVEENFGIRPGSAVAKVLGLVFVVLAVAGIIALIVLD